MLQVIHKMLDFEADLNQEWLQYLSLYNIRPFG